MTTLRMHAATTERLEARMSVERNAINHIGANNTNAMSQPGCSNEIHTESLTVAGIDSWSWKRYGAREAGVAGALLEAAGV